MKHLRSGLLATAIAAMLVASAAADATKSTPYVLEGLAPFSMLLSTAQGREAVATNREITVGIQTGARQQPLLQPFKQQQLQALQDAFITSKNAYDLADGLGSGVGAAYHSLTARDGKISDTDRLFAVESLLVYANAITGADGIFAKCFYANGTAPDDHGVCIADPIAGTKAAILDKAGANTNVYGKAYCPSGAATPCPGGDSYGNPRPFQTSNRIITFTGNDYFGAPSSNMAYLVGPADDNRSSPAFPSGHSTYAYTASVLLGIMVPSHYAQMVTRGAEYANDRIIMGAHYTTDVIAGRTLALYDVAHMLANDSRYLNQAPRPGITPIPDFQQALKVAKTQLTGALNYACHGSGDSCDKDTSRFANASADDAFYESTLTYGLPVVNAKTANTVEDFSAVAPDAGYLLTAAFPTLSLKEADDILTSSEGPGGRFLDNGSEFGLYSRIDLYKAVVAAEKELAARRREGQNIGNHAYFRRHFEVSSRRSRVR
jgi:hypothetical protein